MVVALSGQLTTLASRFLRVEVGQKLCAFNQFANALFGHGIQRFYILFTDDRVPIAEAS